MGAFVGKSFYRLPDEIWSELSAFQVTPETQQKLRCLLIPAHAMRYLMASRRRAGADFVIASLCLKLERGTADNWDDYEESYARRTYYRNLFICSDVFFFLQDQPDMTVTQAIEQAAEQWCVSYATARRVYYSIKEDPAVRKVFSLRWPDS